MVAKGNSLEFLTGSVLVGGASLIIVAGLVTIFISVCGVMGAILLSKCVLGFVSCCLVQNKLLLFFNDKPISHTHR